MIAPITWSATDHSFAGAGAYVGLSSCVQQFTVARWLLPRRAALHASGSVAMRPTHAWPLVYFAVRDPSAVRVIPVRPGRDPGRRHVLLQFDFGHRRPEPPRLDDGAGGTRDLARLRSHCDEKLHGVFVLTVGLAPAAEQDFIRAVRLHEARMSYGEICDRIASFSPPSSPAPPR